LVDNFQNLLELFFGCGKQFHKITTTKNGRRLGKKITGGLATANHVKDGRKKLKQRLLQLEQTIKIFYHKTSLPNE
jgi:hypothetical protein